jgi:hypothetical protein
MINCPHCAEKTISRTKLVLQYFSVPFIIVSCERCNALVNIPHQKNPIMDILLYISWCAALILSMFISFNWFGNFWLGVLFIIVLGVLRAYLKTREHIEYIR